MFSESTSDVGQGNYQSTPDSSDRSPMIYGIFSTPENSVRSSAICAYRLSDLSKVFSGQFKDQKRNWLPVPWDETPKPHPAVSCHNDSKSQNFEHQKFLSSHRLMDQVVPAAGGAPLLVKLSLE